MRVNIDLSEDVLMALFNQAKPLGRSRKRHMEMILEEAVKEKPVSSFTKQLVSNLDNRVLEIMEGPMPESLKDKPIDYNSATGNEVIVEAIKAEGRGKDALKEYWQKRFEQKNK